MPFRIVNENHFHCDARVEWAEGETSDGVIRVPAGSSCYEQAMRIAEQLDYSSISMPLCGTARSAVLSIGKYLLHSDLDVVLVVPKEMDFSIGRDLSDYLFNDYICEEVCAMPAVLHSESIDSILDHPDESFQTKLFRYIDQKGLSDPEVYRRANMDRKLFSKIRCNEDYIPKKKTILSLAIALELGIDETEDLLNSAGYALSGSNKSDLIIRYCIENGIFNIFEVNALLFQYKQPLLV